MYVNVVIFENENEYLIQINVRKMWFFFLQPFRWTETAVDITV